MFSSSTTTSSSTSSSSSTSVSTSTTTIPAIGRITASGDFIIAIFNTSAGQSTGGYNGTFLSFEGVEKAIDGQLSTKYVNYGSHQLLPFFSSVDNPGVDTGFIVTPTRNVSSVACGLLFATGNDYPERDPLTVTLEGTNATSVTALNDGASLDTNLQWSDRDGTINYTTALDIRCSAEFLQYNSFSELSVAGDITEE